MNSTPISPSDEDLAHVVRDLRGKNPSLGAVKLLPLILARELDPPWTVSEKRLRKILQKEGLTVTSGTHPSDISPSASGNVFPTSHTLSHLNIEKWTTKVHVKDFGRKKGKGLVATERIPIGDHIWIEDPVAMSADQALQDLQRQSYACLYCTRPISSSTTPVSCTCQGRYCNRLCHTRGAPAHAFLCPSANPASIPFAEFTKAEKWRAPDAWARLTAVVLSQSKISTTSSDLEQTLDFLDGLAGLSLEERVKVLPNWQSSHASSRALWKRAHTLFVQALKEPPNPAHAKLLGKLKGKNPLPSAVEDTLFSWEGFLLGLGKMSLNLEAHGGLYILHSHINHSCLPNISVRHITRNQTPRITLVAKRAIEPGEELSVSYVNPELEVRNRRRELLDWNFGMCMCTRCVEEADKEEKEGFQVANGQLEDELRGFLGV